MPLKVNEMVIQAKFEDEPVDESSSSQGIATVDIELLKEEILKDCMERVEDYLRKKEAR